MSRQFQSYFVHIMSRDLTKTALRVVEVYYFIPLSS